MVLLSAYIGPGDFAADGGSWRDDMPMEYEGEVVYNLLAASTGLGARSTSLFALVGLGRARQV
jgi:hypothetical protein